MVSPPATPLWRQGPSNKPVLCNACGSRYRHWGTLDNYYPRHCTHPKQIDVSNIAKDSGNANLNGDSGPIIPSKRRSLRVANKRMKLMEKFHKQLLEELKRQEMTKELSLEEDLLIDNVNNFIPSNEIGLGAILLKPDNIN